MVRFVAERQHPGIGRVSNKLSAMHPSFAPILQRLIQIRDEKGMSQDEVDDRLGQPHGWIESYEVGNRDLTLEALATLLHAYDSDFSQLFANLSIDLSAITHNEALALSQSGSSLVLSFMHGRFPATVEIPNATVEQANGLLRDFKSDLRSGKKSPAVSRLMLGAAALWPNANPSDLWLFFVHHSYLNRANHPGATNADLEQSWKRTGGWALEDVFVRHYNPALAPHGIELAMLKKTEVLRLLTDAGVRSHSAAEKADVLMLGKRNGHNVAFGVVHVKASFAERRTDDEPLSRELMALGLGSVLITMDSKATPSATPVNKGELGGEASGGSKRLDIEREGMFQACFSYNARTIPTRTGADVVARIDTLNLNDPNDAFTRFVVDTWAAQSS